MSFNIDSDFLCARPSFWSGLARLIDFGAGFDKYNQSRTEKEADGRAMYSDWANVGQDLLHAVEEDSKENKEAA